MVPNLPLEVLIGADVLSSHQCSLLYSKDNQKRLLFGYENCAKCDRFRTNPEVGALAQLMFVDRNPKHRRNRLKIGAHFVATLPETDRPDQEKNEHKSDTVEANLRSEQCESQTRKMSRLPFSRAEECGTNSASVVQLNLGLPTSAITCCQPESPYLSFVNLVLKADFGSK